MLQREGWNVGKRRVYRLYSLEGLQLQMKVKRRKRIALLRGKPPVPTGPNQHWNMAFVHDQILDGRSVRIIESFNGRLRDEFLNVHAFTTLHDLQQKLRAWQDDCNHHRPHGSLGHLTPCEYVQMWSAQPKEAASLQF